MGHNNPREQRNSCFKADTVGQKSPLKMLQLGQYNGLRNPSYVRFCP